MTKACLLEVTRTQTMHIDALHATLHRLNERITQGAIGVEMLKDVKSWLSELDEATAVLHDDGCDDVEALKVSLDTANSIVSHVTREMRNALWQADCQLMLEATRRPSATVKATHA